MKYNKNISVTIGPGFLSLLGLLFIGLKLAGHITWSWWLVLLPIYIVPAGLVGLLVVLMVSSLFVIILIESGFLISNAIKILRERRI